MLNRSQLTLSLFGLTLASLIALSIRHPLVALIAFCALLVGAGLARLAIKPTTAQTLEESTKAEAIDENASTRRNKRASVPAIEAGVISTGALLDATMNSMREGMLVVDEEMRIVASNRAARDIFAAAGSNTLEAKRLSDVTRQPAIHQAFRSALEERERTETKVEIHVREKRSFDLRVAPLRFGPQGQTRGAIGIFFDITRLERLERVRQEFLSNVSHELRTPLTAIIAFVETLEEGAIDDDENNRRFLAVIRKNATRMHNLIDDILELSAIEAGTVSVEPQTIQLRPLVEDVTTALASRAAKRNVTLHNEVAADAVVYADARKLEQMLANLIDNAIKFNRDGGHVHIKLETAERYRISITDTGDGISDEHLPRIFERFYRVDRARSRELSGTGLGLAIVKHLARAHGGEATVHSTAGHGSTFTVELPKAVTSGK